MTCVMLLAHLLLTLAGVSACIYDMLLQPMRLLKLLGDETYESAMVMVRAEASIEQLRQASFDIILRDGCMTLSLVQDCVHFAHERMMLCMCAAYWPGAVLQHLLDVPAVTSWPGPIFQPYTNVLTQTQPQVRTQGCSPACAA